MNNINEIDNENKGEKELIYEAVFEQIKESRDIISSLLIIYEFIRDENIWTTFKQSELRQFALSAAHNKTSTHLWHINALIATSNNFNDLLIGIEMCFDGWLGNKQSFIKHKYKQQSLNKLPSTTTSKQTIIPKSEITSFVTSYYQPLTNNDDDINNPEQERGENKCNDDEINFDDNPQTNIVHINDENENINLKNDENENENELNNINEEFMKSYRGKISSPISFRMRNQKRLKQRERRQNSSRNLNKNEIYSDLNKNNEIFEKQLDFQHFEKINNTKFNQNKPNILSPFNVSKFAKRVDLYPNDIDSPQFIRKNI